MLPTRATRPKGWLDHIQLMYICLSIKMQQYRLNPFMTGLNHPLKMKTLSIHVINRFNRYCWILTDRQIYLRRWGNFCQTLLRYLSSKSILNSTSRSLIFHTFIGFLTTAMTADMILHLRWEVTLHSFMAATSCGRFWITSHVSLRCILLGGPQEQGYVAPGNWDMCVNITPHQNQLNRPP